MARTAGPAGVDRGTHADPAAPCAPRPLRADAQRNRDRLLAAAKAVFTERGAEASLEEIARRAEVGVGTLYRHFPTRQDLVEAVYVGEVEALCRSAADGGHADSWEALSQWVHGFVDYVATKRALAEELMAAVGGDAPVFRACHDAIAAAGEPLLARAKADGAVRPDVDFPDVLRMVSGITMIRNAAPADVRRVLTVALDGLRYRPGG